MIGSAARAQDDLPAHLVADLHTAFGNNHARAVHAKGVVLFGSFTPDPAARTLSKATVFARPTNVTVRFSDFTGIPTIPDNIGDADPRGFAVKFGPVDNPAMDIVAHSFNGFPVRTGVEFGELMRAIGASSPGAAKPTALDRFLGAHPAAATFLKTQKPPPASYATAAYFGVNTFTFIDAKGHKTAVRYRFIPLAGEHYLDATASKAAGPNYLAPEIGRRVATGPVRFTWLAQVAGAGDKLDDSTVAWPDTRRLVQLGVITINRSSTDQAGDSKRLMFLPGTLPDGIVPADPMIDIRTAAYPVSFSERQ
ncbi:MULTISPECIES: catalase family peroxidase [Sphingosinicellaceae]|uniref:catalase family peroxidase n=1 Tax=Sphingosinicellaceae TaxID=2820280 RepID=UPI001C1E1097|nr:MULTISPECIES: catalase family peroxidase [Polymorphobacter]